MQQQTEGEKEAIEQKLADLEKQIYALETSYLEKTAGADSGNIVRGWEGLLPGGNPQHFIMSTSSTRGGVREVDRIFSLSSVTSPLAVNSNLQQLQQQEAARLAREAEIEQKQQQQQHRYLKT